MNSLDRQRVKMQQSRTAVMGRAPGDSMRWYCSVPGYHLCTEEHRDHISEVHKNAPAPSQGTLLTTRQKARALKRQVRPGHYVTVDGDYAVQRSLLPMTDFGAPPGFSDVTGYVISKITRTVHDEQGNEVPGAETHEIVHKSTTYNGAKEWVRDVAPWEPPISVIIPTMQEEIDALGEDEYWNDPQAKTLHLLREKIRDLRTAGWSPALNAWLGQYGSQNQEGINVTTIRNIIQDVVTALRRVIDAAQAGTPVPTGLIENVEAFIDVTKAEFDRAALSGMPNLTWRPPAWITDPIYDAGFGKQPAPSL